MTKNSDLSRAIWALLALNFFMADMQAGIGPFLGIFLQAHDWQSGLIGTVMTIGGVAGMLMTVQGMGAALSPAIGGWLAQSLGYPVAFTILGGFAVFSVVIWFANSHQLKECCSAQ